MSDWLGMFVPRLPRREPVESRNPPDQDDLDRIAELREQGSRVHLPHPVRAFLAFDTERAARSATDLLRREGYRCTIRAGREGGWTITAVRQIVPTPGALKKLREQLGALAATQGGAYRGWDAPVIY